MKTRVSMHAHQLEQFGRFLAEHPRFSPILVGEGAVVCGGARWKPDREANAVKLLLPFRSF